MKSLAIIGAGISGCTAAWSLRTETIEVHLFEKSRGVSGRAATRRRDGDCYDHGANYIKPTSERVERIIQDHLPADELVDIAREVWTFDANGTVRPGADRAAPMWTYQRGINTLGKLLLAPTSASAHLQTRVQRLHHDEGGWRVEDTDGAVYGPYDAVLLTPPAPQSAAVLAESAFDSSVRATLLDGLRAASYRSQFTVILAYEQPVVRPGSFYGLLNTDGEHSVAWLSFEEDKPGHVDEGSLIVAQMSPAWTQEHYEAPHETLSRKAADVVSDLLDTDLRNPAWTDHQRWRYALPDHPADVDQLKGGRDLGLFFAGDAVRGRGRVGIAMETGLDAATAIREQLVQAA